VLFLNFNFIKSEKEKLTKELMAEQKKQLVMVQAQKSTGGTKKKTKDVPSRQRKKSFERLSNPVPLEKVIILRITLR
jgi:hypothetical protein